MNFITSHAYYRSAQVASILLLPAFALFVILFEVEDRIVVSGVVEAEKQVIISSPIKESLIKRVAVKPGQRVSQGQILIEFTDLQYLRDQPAVLEKRLAFLDAKAESMERLQRQGATAELTAREYRMRAETLRLELKVVRRHIEHLTVKAPFAGVVTAIMVEPYQRMDIGTPLLALSDLEKKIVNCKVPEARFAALKPGQPVAIKSNLLSYLRYDIYDGTVQKYDNYGVENHDEKLVFDTTIALSSSASQALKIGTTAQCEIIVDRCPLYLLFLEKN